MHYDIGNGVILRSPYYGDAPDLVKHGNNPKIALYQRDSYPMPYTIEYARDWIQYVKNAASGYRFVISTEKEAIGEIGLTVQTDVHSHTAELSYWLGEAYWCQGIATRALDFITDYAFSKKNIKRLYADIVEYNIASQRILQKCGFQLDAILRKHMYKNDQYYDQYIFSKLADDPAPSVH
ncbi:MAG: GNAT family N-acetyltransferase [Endozoicomonadaceae bacterium]|nr:GNAT family N-acetyltransferase [Endozoicomonadaceae bacterium]